MMVSKFGIFYSIIPGVLFSGEAERKTLLEASCLWRKAMTNIPWIDFLNREDGSFNSFGSTRSLATAPNQRFSSWDSLDPKPVSCLILVVFHANIL